MSPIRYMASNLKVESVEIALPDKGLASYKDLVEFVQSVLDNRTDVHDDTSSSILANSIVQSILNRVRIGF
jgi:hypothetical protein